MTDPERTLAEKQIADLEEAYAVPLPPYGDQIYPACEGEDDLGAHGEHHPGLSEYLRENRKEIIIAAAVGTVVAGAAVYHRFKKS